jgi:hypothetical protein
VRYGRDEPPNDDLDELREDPSIAPHEQQKTAQDGSLQHSGPSLGSTMSLDVELSSTSSPSPPPARPHPRTLLPADLLPHLSLLQSLETSLSQALTTSLSDRSVLHSSHTRLSALVPRIDAVDLELSGRDGQGKGLKGRIEVVNEIAERVGGKVRGLDLELKRVKEANERLNEVIELKVRPAVVPALEKMRWADPKSSPNSHRSRSSGRPSKLRSGRPLPDLALERLQSLMPWSTGPSLLV